MKCMRSFFLPVAMFCASAAGRAEVSFGLNVSSGGSTGFYFDVSNYYQVPQERVAYLHERHIPDEEIPVVLFLSQRAQVGPDIIVQERLGGRSWMDIAITHHLDAGAFYVPLARDPGPPYGRAYGYYRNHRRGEWNKIRLADADVVNFVNLRFVSEHYGYSPDEVTRYRGHGGHFERIGKKGRGPQGRDKGHDQGRDKGHDQDRERGRDNGRDGDDHDNSRGNGHGQK